MGSFVATLLSGFAADYISGLASTVSLWNGSIEAKDVALNPKLVEGLHLPLAMVSGRVAEISVTVPMWSLGASPTRVRLHGVVMDLSPRVSAKDLTQTEEGLRKRKAEYISALEKQRFERFV